MALVAVSMIVASCGKKMSPEAASAWENVKTTFAAVGSMEAIDQFQSVDEWNEAVQQFNAACQEMVKYETEYSKEVTDSLATLSAKFAEVSEQAAARIQQSVQQALEEAADGEEADEDMEEEEEE